MLRTLMIVALLLGLFGCSIPETTPINDPFVRLVFSPLPGIKLMAEQMPDTTPVTGPFPSTTPTEGAFVRGAWVLPATTPIDDAQSVLVRNQ